MEQVDGVDDATRVGRSLARAELVATIVLAIATVLTAWSAFESSKWGGEMSIAFSEAGALRTQSVAARSTGGQLVQIDLAMYESWLAATAAGDDELAGFHERRFRDEFRPAFEAYLATDPLTNPDAPAGPLVMDEYRVAELDRSAELEAQADAASERARTNNQRGDDYTLLTVLFASVLFFAGVSTKFDSLRARWAMVWCGALVLVAGAVMIATFPIKI